MEEIDKYLRPEDLKFKLNGDESSSPVLATDQTWVSQGQHQNKNNDTLGRPSTNRWCSTSTGNFYQKWTFTLSNYLMPNHLKSVDIFMFDKCFDLK